jgi:hypothetical protein
VTWEIGRKRVGELITSNEPATVAVSPKLAERLMSEAATHLVLARCFARRDPTGAASSSRTDMTGARFSK